jgi:hypothetical protein
MSRCRICGEEVERSFRFCPWCAAPLRLKVTELFPGLPGPDEEGRALRVSRYFADDERDPELRISIWSDVHGRMLADAAVSLDDEEASRLGRFLAESVARDEARTS